ncbi:hypothetical protein CAOG_009373 [Capsaspora owczarzaki ATCC 30864]|uniref:Uncharacterized protein n=1 Tax=Capsaspora owczarzaki (strain ATCC 30864) TaxID=595528 RepID=A0A0D2U331_CAPO3|nr:hypothetical protein CAOG_009373 [Capsaspora owczarzaki ATCC 30864]
MRHRTRGGAGNIGRTARSTALGATLPFVAGILHVRRVHKHLAAKAVLIEQRKAVQGEVVADAAVPEAQVLHEMQHCLSASVAELVGQAHTADFSPHAVLDRAKSFLGGSIVIGNVLIRHAEQPQHHRNNNAGAILAVHAVDEGRQVSRKREHGHRTSNVAAAVIYKILVLLGNAALVDNRVED